jgi:hypothetical protein
MSVAGRLLACHDFAGAGAREEELAGVDAVTIERSVELAAPASRVWAATRTPAALRYVTRGVLRITGLPRTGRSVRAGGSRGGCCWAGCCRCTGITSKLSASITRR